MRVMLRWRLTAFSLDLNPANSTRVCAGFPGRPYRWGLVGEKALYFVDNFCEGSVNCAGRSGSFAWSR
jgi:hypothetical protein